MRKKEFYKDSYNGILNQYLLKIRRQERVEHKFSVMLVVAGVLVVALYNLAAIKPSMIWIISILAIAIVYCISIFHILPKSELDPWFPKTPLDYFENKECFEKLDKNSIKESESIYKQLIFEMYYLTGHTDKIRKRDINFTLVSLHLISFTIFSIPIIYFFSFDTITTISILLIFFIILSIFFIIYKKQLKKKSENLMEKIDKNYADYNK